MYNKLKIAFTKIFFWSRKYTAKNLKFPIIKGDFFNVGTETKTKIKGNSPREYFLIFVVDILYTTLSRIFLGRNVPVTNRKELSLTKYVQNISMDW